MPNFEQMSQDEIRALWIASQEEIAKARKAASDAQRKPNQLSMKVSEKGALSVYGLGRFPVTLYKGQWVRLIGHAKTIVEFMEAHNSQLAVKE